MSDRSVSVAGPITEFVKVAFSLTMDAKVEGVVLDGKNNAVRVPIPTLPSAPKLAAIGLPTPDGLLHTPFNTEDVAQFGAHENLTYGSRATSIGVGRIKASKCEFEGDSVVFLDFMVLRERVSSNPEYIDAVVSFPRPKNLRESRGFMGIVMIWLCTTTSGVYRCCIRRTRDRTTYFQWADGLLRRADYHPGKGSTVVQESNLIQGLPKFDELNGTTSGL
ncbi:hypothetical protein TREMEDRAFT_64444 [Tremella mesenterica DSM 1558]|uniref:uncharacterized protein n=1 Tax=Tremella mesenterica (strain ATCC 24925 / CBS 8224 / DSM 1558 / NBRC 9311 / NRRL Y-6157 / RJB 2259-6 / UBC 559-6) TaxID=578456 RepID=UPI0003F49263|nr:uncharacterized protein TREMEDRAFT_64444 [Tremella mesenterica DSM 1558]EIW67200.1 hypothetical protein TREMEDRAFT_64444 [Tremella mesenterica DSM 1558]